MKLNVLVTSGGSAISQGIIKSVKGSSLDCRVITTDAQPYAAGLYRGNAAYLVPLAKDPNYIEKIIEICKKENIHAIFIGMDYELLPLSENQGLIEKETGAKVIVSSPDTIKISDDKWLTNEFLKSHGFPAIPSSLHYDYNSFVQEQGFPLIIKPRIGNASRNTFVVKSREELDEKVSLLVREAGENEWLSEGTFPIIQKYMGTESDEFTSSTVVFDGKSYGVISMQREMKFPGHTTKAVIDDFPFLTDFIRSVSEKLNPLGPCNFQSRVVDGIPYIFEINCRFSGTTGTCYVAGFNSAEACLRKQVLNEDIGTLKYNKGVMLRYFNESFIPLTEIQRLTKERYLSNPQSTVNDTF